MASTSPLDAVDLENTADSHAPSLDVPSSPSSTHGLDYMLPTGPPLTSGSTVTRYVYAYSGDPSPESSMLAPGAPGQSRPWLSSAPEMGAAAFEDILATPALPLQSPSPLDEAIAGFSRGSLYPEDTGHRRVTSHDRYDIV